MKPIQALIWSEWRQQRNTILVFSGLTVILWLAMFIVMFSVPPIVLNIVHKVLSSIYFFLAIICLGTTSNPLAEEFDKGTVSFLLGIPEKSIKIYLYKYLVSFTIFIIFSIFFLLLMFCFSNMDFIAEVSMGVFAVLILTHSFIFFSKMIARSSIGDIWEYNMVIFGFLYILIIPGMAFVMILLLSGMLGVISSLLLTNIVFCFFTIGFGCFLWKGWISRGLKILKPVIIAACLLFALSWLLYAISYIYSNLTLNMAIRKAKASGMVLDVKKIIPSLVPPEKNGAFGIMKFEEEYAEFRKNCKDYKVIKLLSRHKDWTDTDFSFYGPLYKQQINNFSLKAKYQIADFILNNEEMIRLNRILNEALAKPYLRFEVNYNAPISACINYPRMHVSKNAVEFLVYRAYALRLYGDNKAFFKCLNKINKITTAFNKEIFFFSSVIAIESRKMKYMAAVAAGPNNSHAIQYYQKFIQEIETLPLRLQDQVAFAMEYTVNGLYGVSSG